MKGFARRLALTLARLSEQVWYQGHWLGTLLAPLGGLYCASARLRRWAYARGWLASHAVSVPVIVVGNLTVGGTGKTPLVLWLAEHLIARGERPGIVLRGYGAPGSERGGKTARRPRRVTGDADPSEFGDEAVLLAQRARCPVVVGRDRVAAARVLVEEFGCNRVLSDDGLQHERLRRQLEILVVDGLRGFGNGRCLPAGPLREPIARRHEVDLVINNGGPGADETADADGIADADGGANTDGFQMQLEPGAAVNLRDPACQRASASWFGQPVTAVAGIGHPQRFFALLRGFGLEIEPRPYPDHHRFNAADLEHWPKGPVLMTEKDAVKCRAFAGPDQWFVPVTAVPGAAFVDALDAALDQLGDRLGDFPGGTDD
ncbi:tetraacyldisaccharide 4'-kinase [Halochromatium salexigens]|uniref:tetraacyldisaccharide 4'-kinase n=1 Tax=Halochromatium salexigens TaxID=49447 RepID=UPI0030B82B6E